MITKMERLKVKKHTVDSLSYCVGSADHDHDHHIYASHDNHDCHDNHDKKTGVSVDDEGRKGKREGGKEGAVTEPQNRPTCCWSCTATLLLLLLVMRTTMIIRMMMMKILMMMEPQKANNWPIAVNEDNDQI